MSFKEHLRKVMLTYPRLFPAPICVYDHLFLTIGNGYEWQDGELVYAEHNVLVFKSCNECMPSYRDWQSNDYRCN